VSRRLEALAILRLLNEARRIGQGYAAEMLDEHLDDLDQRGGYSRTIDVVKPAKLKKPAPDHSETG